VLENVNEEGTQLAMPLDVINAYCVSFIENCSKFRSIFLELQPNLTCLNIERD
jgi:hypothetical protein